MKVFVGADHRGFHIKNSIVEYLNTIDDVQVVDCGAKEYVETDDFPHYAGIVAHNVKDDDAARGILICGSGVGMCIVANKVHHIRATKACDIADIREARQHDDINILCLSAQRIRPNDVPGMVHTFLFTEFDQESRRVRRLAQITQLETSDN